MNGRNPKVLEDIGTLEEELTFYFELFNFNIPPHLLDIYIKQLEQAGPKNFFKTIYEITDTEKEKKRNRIKNLLPIETIIAINKQQMEQDNSNFELLEEEQKKEVQLIEALCEQYSISHIKAAALYRAKKAYEQNASEANKHILAKQYKTIKEKRKPKQRDYVQENIHKLKNKKRITYEEALALYFDKKEKIAFKKEKKKKQLVFIDGSNRIYFDTAQTLIEHLAKIYGLSFGAAKSIYFRYKKGNKPERYFFEIIFP